MSATINVHEYSLFSQTSTIRLLILYVVLNYLQRPKVDYQLSARPGQNTDSRTRVHQISTFITFVYDI